MYNTVFHETPELPVVTYNTRREWGGRDPALDKLLSEGRFLVCLQEVSPVRTIGLKKTFGARSFISPAKHGLQYLATILPKNASFLWRRTIQPNGHLGLVPAAWSVRRGCALYRAGHPGWIDALEPRIAQESYIYWRGVEFQLVNTHLPLLPGLKNEDFAQLQQVLQSEGSLLVGDLNATRKNLFLNDLMLARGLSAAGSCDATHDSGRRIDYVMFGGGFREAGYSLEESLSDHRLVQAILEV